MEASSHKLAEKIIERLVDAGLLTDQNGKKILPKLVEGGVREEDWRLAFELSDPEEGRS